MNKTRAVSGAALAILAIVAVLAWRGVARAQTAPKPLVVFAAASLQNALKDVGAAYTGATGQPVTFSFAGSSAMARQIEEGAPAEVFVSADPDWMDYLEKKGLVRPGSRHDLLTNHLALIAPKDSAVRLKIAPGFPLAAALGADGRLAMADPNAVPAGLYGKAALQKLGVWPAVEHRVAIGENVRAALLFVARGEAPLGIVYDTDAKVEPQVRIVDLFPDDSHPPIRYPAAATRGAAQDASRFLDFLSGPQARAVFAHYGFQVLGR